MLTPIYHFIKTDLYKHILLNAAAGEIEPGVTNEHVSAANDEFHLVLSEAYNNARNDLERAYVGYVKTLFSDEWNDAGDYLDSVFELTSCGRNEQWTQILSIPSGRANQALEFFNNMSTCDPLSTIPWINAAMASLYFGDPAQALSIADTAIERVGFTPLLERTRFQALLAADQLEDAQQSLQNLSGRAHTIGQLGLYAALGDREAAAALINVLYEQSDQVISGELPGKNGVEPQFSSNTAETGAVRPIGVFRFAADSLCYLILTLE